VDRITGSPGRLLDYGIQAVTVGKDAQGEVSMRVAFDKDVVSGKAIGTDIVQASANAYLNCVNRMLTARCKATKTKTAKPK
jgi:2-isopropylmalate synthase